MAARSSSPGAPKPRHLTIGYHKHDQRQDGRRVATRTETGKGVRFIFQRPPRIASPHLHERREPEVFSHSPFGLPGLA